MSFAQNYFNRFNSSRTLISEYPASDLGIIIVIPCYSDEHIFDTLESVLQSNKTSCSVELIIIINYSESADESTKKDNISIFTKLKSIALKHNQIDNHIKIHPIILKDINKKHAGVGFARKTGMDESVRRFDCINNSNGLIVSLDADTLINRNYLSELESILKKEEKTGLIIPQFLHNFDDESLSSEHIKAAKTYETYLRYFRLSLNYCGFPFPLHTIGSCFAVKANVYIKSGGMNKRQGGEDFYFIHKTTALTRVKNLKEVFIFPSARISERVPFGTGPAIKDILQFGNYKVYDFDIFLELKDFFKNKDLFFEQKYFSIQEVSKIIIDSLGEEKLEIIFADCLENSANIKTYRKRFFTHFNAFTIIKILNYLDTNDIYPKISIDLACKKLFQAYNYAIDNSEINEIHKAIFALDIQYSNT